MILPSFKLGSELGTYFHKCQILNSISEIHLSIKLVRNRIVLLSFGSVHEPHYDVLAAAVAGTAATMLTLLAMLGGTGLSSIPSKMLFDAQLVVLELAMVTGITGIIRRSETTKRKLTHSSAILLIAGTILVSLGAAAY